MEFFIFSIKVFKNYFLKNNNTFRKFFQSLRQFKYAAAISVMV